MFKNLTSRLGNIFDLLHSRGLLNEQDISNALREIRIALLEADVALPVIKDLIISIKAKALGQEVLKSITPGQMVVKIVHEELIGVLGQESVELNLRAPSPVVVLVVGLQGSGKTTSTAKIANFVRNKHHSKILIASVDVYRPAAQEQLAILGKQVNIDTLPIIATEKDPIAIGKRAYEVAKLNGYDLLLIDTAGRLHTDDMLNQLTELKNLLHPTENLLVVDAMTGQDAVNIANVFHQQLGITGLMLTRLDGDGRGGAALSLRHITGCPIKFIGVGEQLQALEVFNPRRIADRILDKGDIIALVEKTSEIINQEEAEKLSVKMHKGEFNLEDFATQLQQITKLGGIGGFLDILPGVKKLKAQFDQSGIDDKVIVHQLAIINSMTKKERCSPKLLNASRRRRIALGSGRSVVEVNRLLKQHQEMASAMKKLTRWGEKGLKRQALSALFGKKFI